jgi:hypothetical protein
LHADSPTENAAWVDVDLPQPVQEVAAYLQDIERLLRLNPHLEIRRFASAPQGFELDALNEMNGLPVLGRLTFREIGPRGFALDYADGLKQATEVSVEARGAGSRLRIRETYRQPQSDAELEQVDRSLTPWGQAIRRHFLGLARWGWLPGYRRCRERLWLAMRPRERRVTRLIAWATAIEFVLFVAAVWLFWS